MAHFSSALTGSQPDQPKRRASGASDRKELADVERRFAVIIAVIEDGGYVRGYVRGMVERLRELNARQDERKERLSAAPADLPDIHPNVANTYGRSSPRRWTIRGTATRRRRPSRGLIDHIVLTPGKNRGEMNAVLHGDFGTILEWAGGGNVIAGLGGCGGRI